SYFNTTASMERFNATFNGGATALDHGLVVNTSVMYTNLSPTPIDESDGIMSPFILPVDLALTEIISTITVPLILFTSTDPLCTDNFLKFPGTMLTLNYTGIKRDWFNASRGLKEFKIETGLVDACIRFDSSTGIMVYFNYNDKTAGAGKRIYVGLYHNNMDYPIDLQIEKRLECASQWDTFIDALVSDILYDPPGDKSYTRKQEGTTRTFEFRTDNSSTKSGIFFDLKFAYSGIGAGGDFSYRNNEGNSSCDVLSITDTRSYTSSTISNNPDYIGPGKGDLYFGYGMLVHYEFYVNNHYFVINASDKIDPSDRDLRVYTVGSHVASTITPNTTFSVLAADLGNLNMTSLTAKNKFSDNFLNSAERSRVKERDFSPYYFSGGVVSEFSTKNTVQNSTIITTDIVTDWSVFFYFAAKVSAGAFGATFVIFESDGKIGTKHHQQVSTRNTTTYVTEDSLLVHLEDDDAGDVFSLRMYDDLEYNGVGFIVDTASTYTSRPFEALSSDRRPPTACEFTGLGSYQQGVTTLQAIAIDEELHAGNENNIFQVDFYWDDDPVFGSDKTFIGTQTYLQKLPTDDPNIFYVVWDTRLRPTGYYYLFAVAWDIGPELPPYSNCLVSRPAGVLIDNSAPSSCSAIAYGPYSAAINLYTNTFDAESGIDHVEYWDGVPSSTGSKLLGVAFDPGNSYNFVWATSPGGSDDGVHHVYARAFDRAGNSLVSPVLDIDVRQSSTEQQPSGIDPGTAILIGFVIIAAAVIALGFLLRSRPVLGKHTRAVPTSVEKEPLAVPDKKIHEDKGSKDETKSGKSVEPI
nr:hypothetical protein [Candidatus Sigynarchaeota archaeon]